MVGALVQNWIILPFTFWKVLVTFGELCADGYADGYANCTKENSEIYRIIF
jgi:hypothetical protein